MKSSALQTIEKQLPLLSREEQLWLIEHLAKQLRRRPQPANFEADLIAMANDPAASQGESLNNHFIGAHPLLRSRLSVDHGEDCGRVFNSIVKVLAVTLDVLESFTPGNGRTDNGDPLHPDTE